MLLLVAVSDELQHPAAAYAVELMQVLRWSPSLISRANISSLCHL